MELKELVESLTEARKFQMESYETLCEISDTLDKWIAEKEAKESGDTNEVRGL